MQSCVRSNRVAAAALTCLVAASDKFLRVQRQFWTSLWLGSVRWRPRACIPPEQTHSVTYGTACCWEIPST